MKVKELKEKLQGFDDDLEVMLEIKFAEPTDIDKIELVSDSYTGKVITYIGLFPREEIMEQYEEADKDE